MKIGKKVLSVVLCLMIVFGTITFGQGVFIDNLINLSVSAASDTYSAYSEYSIGDKDIFGNYPQEKVTDEALIVELSSLNEVTDNTYFLKGNKYYKKDGVFYSFSPIEWVVVNVDDKLYLLADKILDKHIYSNTTGSDVTWENSEMRYFLNNTFYNMAFSNDEKLQIINNRLTNTGQGSDDATGPDTNDNVFLLSLHEVWDYPTEILKAFLTDFTGGSGTGYWGLRNRAHTLYHGYYCYRVQPNGEHWGINENSYRDFGVRPAIRLNLNSDNIIDGKVSVTIKPDYSYIKYYDGKAYSNTGKEIEKLKLKITISNGLDEPINDIAVIVYSPKPIGFDNMSSPDTISEIQAKDQYVYYRSFSIGNGQAFCGISKDCSIYADLYWNGCWDSETLSCTDESRHVTSNGVVQFRFNIDSTQDVFSFKNIENSFIADGEATNYLISDYGWSKLKWNCVPAAYAYSVFHFGGACYGMSCLLSQLNRGNISANNFGSSTVIGLDMPKNNHKLRDAIYIIQLLQLSENFFPEIGNMFTSQENLVKQVVDEIRSGKYPVVNISDGWTSKHAVLAHNVTETDEYYYIDIINPNSQIAELSQIAVSKTDYSFKLVDGDITYSKITTILTDDSSMNVETYAPGFCSGGNDLLSKAAKKSSTRKTRSEADSKNDSYTIITIQDFNRIKVSNSNGEKLLVDYKEETVDGDLDAFVSATTIGDSAISVFIKNNEDTSSELYTIESDDSYTAVISSGDSAIVSCKLVGKGSSKLLYSTDGYASLKSENDGGYRLELISTAMINDILSVCAEGQKNTFIAIRDNDDVFSIESNEPLNNGNLKTVVFSNHPIENNIDSSIVKDKYHIEIGSNGIGTETPMIDAKLKIPSTTEVEYASTVTVKAKAADVPEGYYVALYDGKALLKKGSNTEVSYTFPGEFTSAKTLTVKIIDDNENVQKDGNDKDLSASFEVKPKSGFFARLIAFFKRLFGALPKVTVEPK